MSVCFTGLKHNMGYLKIPMIVFRCIKYLIIGIKFKIVQQMMQIYMGQEHLVYGATA